MANDPPSQNDDLGREFPNTDRASTLPVPEPTTMARIVAAALSWRLSE
jgi:hypothetical protein